jgi:ubiquinone/menaquinone biosynthesis C-methylase UbiE
MPHKFDAAKANVLDSPERMQFLDPGKIFDIIGLEKEMVFADLGCGTGYFSIPASSRVKEVIVLDVQHEMLDILRNKIRKEGIKNIWTILSEESSIPLPDGSVDVLFMANVFHELEDKTLILREVKRVLAIRGKLVIIDWKKMEMDFGPPLEERLTEEEVISVCKKNGFEVRVKKAAEPYNYVLVFSTGQKFK